MSCLPWRCRCEERLLAPFIAHYNRHTDSAYAFQERLDVGSHTPQPEALYVDTETERRLVVERKNLIWPSDYAQIHDTLHTMTGIIGTIISPHLHADRPYEFAMPDRIRGSLPELRQHAEEVGKEIVRRVDAVHGGDTVGSQTAGREWSFRLEGIHERDWDEPAAGIRYVFNGRLSALHRGDIPVDFAGEFKRLVESASRKFTDHIDAKRLLVIDFHGDAQHPRLFIDELLTCVSIPPNVDEIWMSTYVLVTELHYGWIHQQLWPIFGEAVSESGETVVPLG